MKKRLRWIKSVRREYPPLIASCFYRGYCNRRLWKEYVCKDYILDDLMLIEGQWYYPSYHMEDFAKDLTERLFSDRKLFMHLKKISLEKQRIYEASRKKGFKEFTSSVAGYVQALAIYHICDDFMENKLNGMLKEKMTQKEAEELMKYIVLPYEDNFNVKENLSIIKNNDKKHLRLFSWFNSRYGVVKDYPIENVHHKRKDLIEDKYLEKYKERKKSIHDAVILAKRLFGLPGLS